MYIYILFFLNTFQADSIYKIECNIFKYISRFPLRSNLWNFPMNWCYCCLSCDGLCFSARRCFCKAVSLWRGRWRCLELTRTWTRKGSLNIHWVFLSLIFQTAPRMKLSSRSRCDDWWCTFWALRSWYRHFGNWRCFESCTWIDYWRRVFLNKLKSSTWW